jgi:hypothetical protein
MRSLRSPWRKGPFCATKKAEASFDTEILDTLVKKLPPKIDMSFPKQWERILQAAKKLGRFTMHELATESKAGKGAVNKFCMQFCKVSGGTEGRQYRGSIAIIYEPKEIVQ